MNITSNLKIYLNVYIVSRKDEIDYDEYDELTIVAENEEQALKMANDYYGEWKVIRKVSLYTPEILTASYNAG